MTLIEALTQVNQHREAQAALHWGSLATALVVLGWWARGASRSDRRVAGAALCVVAVVAMVTWAVSPEWVPADWVTPLWEGRTARTVGLVLHGRIPVEETLGLASPSELPVALLRVHVGIGLNIAATAVMSALWWFQTRSARATVALAVLWSANLIWLHGMMSLELGAFVSWQVVGGAAVLAAGLGSKTAAIRALAWFTAFAWWIPAMGARRELFVAVVGVLAVTLVRVVKPEDATSTDEAWGSWVDSVRDDSRLGTLIAVGAMVSLTYAATVSGWFLAPEVFPMPPWVYPLDGRVVLLADLVMVLSPAVVGLVLLGVLHGSRRPVETGGLVVVTLIISKIYERQGHFGNAPFETLRYYMMLQVPLGLFMGWGWVVAREWLATSARPEWKWAGLGLALAIIPPRFPSVGPTESGEGWPLVSRNLQFEGRTLTRWLSENPDCLFSTRAAFAQGDEKRPQFVDVHFRLATEGPGSGVFEIGEVPPVADPTAARFETEAECALFYWGLDCWLDGGPEQCERAAGGLEVVEERVIEALEYNTHHGDHPRDLSLRLLRIR